MRALGEHQISCVAVSKEMVCPCEEGDYLAVWRRQERPSLTPKALLQMNCTVVVDKYGQTCAQSPLAAIGAYSESVNFSFTRVKSDRRPF